MSEENPTFYNNESQNIAESSSTKSGAKRRASRAGTRSVASLTPEQLSRKRANDREAQRSIRQRAKNHIEDLERRIRELSGKEGQQSLEDVLRRNAELEEELKHLKEILSRAGGSATSSPELAPLSNRYGADMTEPSYAYSHQWLSSPSLSSLSSSPVTTGSGGELTLPHDYPTMEYGFPDPGSARSDTFSSSLLTRDMAGVPHQSAPAVNRRGMPFSSRPHFGRSMSHPNGRLGQSYQLGPSGLSARMNPNMIGMSQGPMLNQTPISTSNRSVVGGNMVQMDLSPTTHLVAPTSNPLGIDRNVNDVPIPRQMQPALVNEAMPGVVSPMPGQAQVTLNTGGNMSERTTFIQNQREEPGYNIPSSFVNQPSLHAWEIPPRYLPPTGPVDSILIGLLQRQRSMALSGAASAALIGPYHPDLRGLLNLEKSASTHPISSVLTDVILRAQMRGLAEKAATLCIVYRLIQWQISPAAETYNNIPDWYIPRASQLNTEHPIWSTLVIWGELRDVVINNQAKYATEEFRHIYTSNLNLNWPYRDQDILIFQGDEMRSTDVFMRHINDLRNWSLDGPFQRRYPELQHACRFSELPGQQPITHGNHQQ